MRKLRDPFLAALAIMVFGVLNAAAYAEDLEGIVLSRIEPTDSQNANFEVANRSQRPVEYLGSSPAAPAMAYNPDKLDTKDGCIVVPNIPGLTAHQLNAGETLQFEYMDPSKVQAYAVFIREIGSKCWHAVIGHRS